MGYKGMGGLDVSHAADCAAAHSEWWTPTGVRNRGGSLHTKRGLQITPDQGTELLGSRAERSERLNRARWAPKRLGHLNDTVRRRLRRRQIRVVEVLVKS
jgi:hypothetical protein